MDLFPLWNSLRIAVLATTITFLIGIYVAWKCMSIHPIWKAVADCVFTLPLVLPPTVIGFFLLKVFSPNSGLGAFLKQIFDYQIIMTWQASVIAVVVVTFPLMYRTARGAFESFDQDLLYAGQTLGKSDRWIFWHVLLPGCKKSLIAGVILAFARGLGEYGATSMIAGYIPGRTATISTTVYQLWREGNDVLAYQWVVINIAISLLVLISMHMIERKR